MTMNKYKRALIALARVAFIHADETHEGNALVRQSLYRHLCAVGIVKYKDGKFIYEQKSDDEYFFEGYKCKIYNEEELRKPLNFDCLRCKCFINYNKNDEVK